LRIDLEPWEESDTGGYLISALAQAGRKTLLFTDDAVLRLHALSGGIPRRVNQLAALALVAGAGRQLSRIDADTINSVYRELGVIETAA
jgi:type II secretory pathway predicted ATPase ExeA